MTTGSSYYDSLRASGENLASREKQASRRARLYRLEDNGASDLAHRRRAAKDSIATHREMIARIEARQAGNSHLPPHPQDLADRLITGHRDAIRKLAKTRAEVGPAVNIIAPMTRRVAREDRRRDRRNGR